MTYFNNRSQINFPYVTIAYLSFAPTYRDKMWGFPMKSRLHPGKVLLFEMVFQLQMSSCYIQHKVAQQIEQQK